MKESEHEGNAAPRRGVSVGIEDGIVIAVVTAACCAISAIYERGYAKHFRMPTRFIEVDILNLVRLSGHFPRDGFFVVSVLIAAALAIWWMRRYPTYEYNYGSLTPGRPVRLRTLSFGWSPTDYGPFRYCCLAHSCRYWRSRRGTFKRRTSIGFWYRERQCQQWKGDQAERLQRRECRAPWFAA